MPVTELRIQGYRSIRDLTLPLKRVNVIVGPNGCGKSNLYQSVAILRAAAGGTLARTLADEGGMPSVLWAGPRKEGPIRMSVGVTIDDYEYELELGVPARSYFMLDPVIKSETIHWTTRDSKGKRSRRSVLDRNRSSCDLVDADLKPVSYVLALSDSESVFDQIVDPKRFPVVDDLRRKLMKWRFYHGFRTDQDSPLRRPQIGVKTAVMSASGEDLAAALMTIQLHGDSDGLDESIHDAFPGSILRIDGEAAGMEVTMTYGGIGRPMQARELSDGTLRYLCLLAALLSPTPAPLIALNEPETSLHEDLLPPLARLIARAAEQSQIWLTTHSQILAGALCELTGVKPIELAKVDGETVRARRPKGLAYSAEWDG